jgi:hypothetical protein
MNQVRKVIVTHHAPDLDATGAVWLLKRFESQHFANAKVFFVNPGTKITDSDARLLEVSANDVVHVDTGLGEFDHHQPDRGLEMKMSASSLVYDHVCEVHPELKEDKALSTIVEFITDVDHFGEVFWPDAANLRYSLMIHELIRGLEFSELHNDDSQLHFAMTCLDSAYSTMKEQLRAIEIIEERGERFQIGCGQALAVETHNDDVLKLGQKQGNVLVIKKDPDEGHIRIKARPDSPIDLTRLYQEILKKDSDGTWYNHPSGKMLLNGSDKHRNQKASGLHMETVVEMVKALY